MTVEERKQFSVNTIQNIILENREKLTISGVLDVLSFDDQIVIVETDLGLLTVKGENLRINIVKGIENCLVKINMSLQALTMLNIMETL